MKIIFISFITSVCLIGCSKSNGSDESGSNQNITPGIKITDVTQARLASNVDFQFQVTIDNIYDKDVSVSYTTIAGTAVEGKDFIAGSGVLTIPSGKKTGVINITVTGDSLRQNNLIFYVQLSSPKNATLITSKGTATIITEDLIYLPTDSSGYTSPTTYSGYNLVWNDEFTSNTLNTNDWNFEIGGNGWGNHELEYYTNRLQNIFCSNGNLIIEARKENYNGNNYTSARLNTAGKKQFQFGRIDIRAKIPVSSGMWPALWMLGSNFSQAGWPGCGETDIMELIGKNPKQVVGSYHWLKGDGSEGTVNNVYNLASQDFSQEFHVFSLIWEQDNMQLLIDGQSYVTGTSQNILTGTYPFNSPFFFIFNVAVGGDWPGPPDNTTVFPQRMFVDYIRVFQK